MDKTNAHLKPKLVEINRPDFFVHFVYDFMASMLVAYDGNFILLGQQENNRLEIYRRIVNAVNIIEYDHLKNWNLIQCDHKDNTLGVLENVVVVCLWPVVEDVPVIYSLLNLHINIKQVVLLYTTKFGYLLRNVNGINQFQKKYNSSYIYIKNNLYNKKFTVIYKVGFQGIMSIYFGFISRVAKTIGRADLVDRFRVLMRDKVLVTGKFIDYSSMMVQVFNK